MTGSRQANTVRDAVTIPNEQAAVGEVFLAALAKRDYEALEGCFEEEARFRALIPPGLREGTGPQQAVGFLRKWFGDSDLFEMQYSQLDQVMDRLSITYRIHCREEGTWYLVEQQAYCKVNNGLITDMNLLCSGFRPEPPQTT